MTLADRAADVEAELADAPVVPLVVADVGQEAAVDPLGRCDEQADARPRRAGQYPGLDARRTAEAGNIEPDQPTAETIAATISDRAVFASFPMSMGRPPLTLGSARGIWRSAHTAMIERPVILAARVLPGGHLGYSDEEPAADVHSPLINKG